MDLKLIQEAQKRIELYTHETPLLHSRQLSLKLGKPFHAWLKLESQQLTGSFKTRPAFNGLIAHLQDAKKFGVVASSSGNFAIAVAYATNQFSVGVKVVMMKSASPLKQERARALGADLILCEDGYEARLQKLNDIKKETGSILLHQYDSLEAISGDGTIGLELISQLPEEFTLLIPMSGGGLAAGVSVAVKALRPKCQIIGLVPQANRWLGDNLKGETIADALVPATPGKLTKDLVAQHVEQILMISDAEIRAALRFLSDDHKLIVEPGAAISVAPLLSGRFKPRHHHVICLISGGNISLPRLTELTS